MKTSFSKTVSSISGIEGVSTIYFFKYKLTKKYIFTNTKIKQKNIINDVELQIQID